MNKQIFCQVDMLQSPSKGLVKSDNAIFIFVHAELS